MIFLFSSNSRRQYAQDVLNITALPCNATIRFRYDLKWVDPTFKDAEGTRIKEFAFNETDEVLIVYANLYKKGFLEERLGNEEISFLPLRRAKIVDFSQDGSILHLCLKLESFVDWTQFPDKAGLVSLDKVIKSFIDIPINIFVTKRFEISDQIQFVNPSFISYRSFYDRKPEELAWQSLVNAISSFDTFREAVFFRIDGIKDRFNNNLSIKNEVLHKGNRFGYKLIHNWKYSLNLSIFNPTESLTMQRKEIDVSSEDKIFPFAPKPTPIHYKYDREVINIVHRENNHKKYSRLNLSIISDDDSLAPSINIHLILVNYLPVLALSIFILILGFGFNIFYSLQTIGLEEIDIPLWLKQWKPIADVFISIGIPLLILELRSSRSG